jgi:hypothetical protein
VKNRPSNGYDRAIDSNSRIARQAEERGTR